jgi:uncharacterized protein YecE (DUF72 family)
MSDGSVNIGTSGWNYSHWRGTFYPEGLPQKDWLGFYAERLRTVEINNTFYNLPELSTLELWKRSVPPHFLFSVKASRYITHMKKLKDPQQSTERFFERIAVLKEKLGPVLFQLPPRWKRNPERLNGFLELLPADFSYTFEFRDPSWFEQGIYSALRRRQAAFCIYHLAGEMSPKEITADFLYIRLHGPGNAYQGRYDTETLSGWAGAISTWSRRGKSVFCYFDNDQNGYAAENALELQSMLE